MSVSVIGLGGASLGGVYQKTDDNSAIRTVHKALELGVNFIDVAPYYVRC
jgi:L-galactose dehydrogenase